MKSGNVLDLEKVVKDYKGNQPHAGLGRAMLVRGEVKPVAVVLGGLTGVPVQQLVSQIGLQQLAGASPILADGITAGGGVVLHIAARTSFTLGMALMMASPMVAFVAQKAVAWVAGLLKKAPQQNLAPVMMPGQNIVNRQPAPAIPAPAARPMSAQTQTVLNNIKNRKVA